MVGPVFCRISKHPSGSLAGMVLILSLVYVGATLSPSSYNIIFQAMGISGHGPYWGSPQDIRGDEWGVITPLTQATVNNGLKRYNDTSFYHEDLRMTISMPIWDWGLIFKPTQWLYPWVHPAYAFSFHHFWITAGFLLGYFFLFQRLNFDRSIAAIMSGLLFFSAFTQHWWTALGPVLAYFPWIMVTILAKYSWHFRVPLLFWLCVSWCLAFFYPPVIISLGFVGAGLYLVYRPPQETWWISLILACSAGLAILLACFYLRDYLISSIDTLYPGQRRSAGGDVSLLLWLTTFSPDLVNLRGKTFLPGNLCENSLCGSWYLLTVFLFMDGRNRRALISLPFAQASISLFCVSAWMHFPLPTWIGRPLLWHFVPPIRMAFAAGFLWLLVAALIARDVGLRFSWFRLMLVLAILASSLVYGATLAGNTSQSKVIAHAVIGLGCIMLIWPPEWVAGTTKPIVLGVCCLLANIISFGKFNPLQSAWPIFERPTSMLTRGLDRLAIQENGTLRVAGFFGASLNGWGYRSVGHVLAVPDLITMRRLFPEMTEVELNETFNRYAHIFVTPEVMRPVARYMDQVAIPGQEICSQLAPRVVAVASNKDIASGKSCPSAEGFLDAPEMGEKSWLLRGWARPKKSGKPQRFLYDLASLQAQGLGLPPRIRSVYRPDLVELYGDDDLLCAGFVFDLPVSEVKDLGGPESKLQVIALGVENSAGQTVALCGTQRGKQRSLTP